MNYFRNGDKGYTIADIEKLEAKVAEPEQAQVNRKIIQFQAMPNDDYWKGITLVLCDDGILYSSECRDGELEVYVNPKQPEVK